MTSLWLRQPNGWPGCGRHGDSRALGLTAGKVVLLAQRPAHWVAMTNSMRARSHCCYVTPGPGEFGPGLQKSGFLRRWCLVLHRWLQRPFKELAGGHRPYQRGTPGHRGSGIHAVSSPALRGGRHPALLELHFRRPWTQEWRLGI